MKVYYINSGVETEIAEAKDYTEAFEIMRLAINDFGLEAKYWRGVRGENGMIIDFGNVEKFFKIGW